MTTSQSTRTQLAIDPNKNIAVFASAGTGKTHLLVHRILKLLLNNVDPSNILAITFTRKAAAEMRERLMKILADWASLDDQRLKLNLQELLHIHDPNSITKAKKLYEQLLFSDHEIQITTFHAFCQDILKRFALHADVPVGFHLIESTQELMQEACERLHKTALQDNEPNLKNALYTLLKHVSTVNNVNAVLETFIDSRSDWWSFTEHQDNPVNHAIKCLEKFLCIEDKKQKPFRTDTQFISKLHQYQSFLLIHNTKTFQNYSNLISAFINNDSNNKPLETLYPIFFKADSEPRKISHSKILEHKLGIEKLDHFLQLHDELTTILAENIDIARRKELLEFNRAWFQAGHHLLNEYQQLKLSRNILDFDDLEWHTYLLLNKQNNADWIQFKLDQRIEHILIDEFQDTNPTQWNLLFPLLEELAANLQQSNKSLFFVGDTKQSIYGFRRANPHLQYMASEWAKQNLAAELLETNQSYRSSPAIIDFINCVFGNKKESLINNFRNHTTAQELLWGYVQVNQLIKPEINDSPILKFRNPFSQTKNNVEINCHFKEGQIVADQIKKLLADKTAIFENGQQRSLRYKDIIILTRSRTHTPQLELALREQQIPYNSVSDSNFLDQLEVQDILALLTYLIQPHNDLALAHILRSPCFGISDEDLMEIANFNAENWNEKIINYVKSFPNSLLSEALTKLNQWREMVNRVPVHDLLDKIYFEINIFERYINSCPSTKKVHVVANLKYLLQLALDIDAGRYSSVQSFLDSIYKPGAINNFSNTAVLYSDNTDAVHIMTIHAAKGLEAPVVFLVDTGSIPSKQRAYQSIVNWPHHAKRPEQFLIIGKKQTIDKKTQSKLSQQLDADWKEELNLLYVALTRAKQFLFISGVQSKKDKQKCWHSVIDQALTNSSHDQINGVWKFEHGKIPKVEEKKSNKKSSKGISSIDLNKPFTNLELQKQNTLIDAEYESEQIQHGILVHKLLELLAHTDLEETIPLHTKTESALNKEINFKKFDIALEEVKQCINSPRLKEIFNAKDSEILNEVPIGQYENKTIQYRIIDRLIISDQLAWIIDFKTTTEVNNNTAQQHALHYQKQISAYYSAVKKMYPDKEVRASILFTAIAYLYTFTANELSS